MRRRRCWFDSLRFCDGPRSQNDYIELARLSRRARRDVPIFGTLRTRRAASSANYEFYDQRKLIVPPRAIERCIRASAAFEFEHQPPAQMRAWSIIADTCVTPSFLL
jgi:cell division protein ZapE